MKPGHCAGLFIANYACTFKAFTQSQRAIMAQGILAYERKEAKKRQREGQLAGGRPSKSDEKTIASKEAKVLTGAPSGKAAYAAAQAVGVSRASVERATRIARDGHPGL